MANPDAAVVVLDPLAAVVALAEAAYRMGAKDARHLCRREAERLANAVTHSAPGHEQALGAAQVLDEINALEPARAMPCFTAAASVALGAPTSDAEVCAECGGTVEPERAGTGWPTCGCVPNDVPSDGTEQDEVDVADIVAEYLEQHGYDGLYNDDCGCELPDLAPCGDLGRCCRPGYRTPCTCGDHDWHIGPQKAEDEHA